MGSEMCIRDSSNVSAAIYVYFVQAGSALESHIEELSLVDLLTNFLKCLYHLRRCCHREAVIEAPATVRFTNGPPPMSSSAPFKVSTSSFATGEFLDQSRSRGRLD